MTHFLQTPGAKLINTHYSLGLLTQTEAKLFGALPVWRSPTLKEVQNAGRRLASPPGRPPGLPPAPWSILPPCLPPPPAPSVARSPPTPGLPRWRVRDQEAGCSRGRDAGPGSGEKPRGGTRLSGPGEGALTRSQLNPGAGTRFPEGRLGRARGTARCLTRALR